MKIWGVLCLLGFVSDLDARVMNASDRSDREERSGVGVPTHFEEEPQAGSSKDQKGELSSFLKENSENMISSKEEIEKPESFLIVNTAEKSTPPGGGVRFIDPHIALEKLVPTPVEVPWWELWWDGVTAWLFGESSEN